MSIYYRIFFFKKRKLNVLLKSGRRNVRFFVIISNKKF